MKRQRLIKIDGSLYDISDYITQHPGGMEVFKNDECPDLTEDFNNAHHSEYAKRLLQKFKLGSKSTSSSKKSKKNKCMKSLLHITIPSIFIKYVAL